MGFFKEFKDDFSEAVNDIVSDEEFDETEEVNDTTPLNTDIDVESELNKLDGLLEQVSKKVDNNESIASKNETNTSEVTNTMDFNEELKNTTRETVAPTPVAQPVSTPVFTQTEAATDETALITAGMKITGNIESAGSVDVQGAINGDVACNGKLVVTGSITGNSTSSEFFADAAKIEGEVNTSGTAKIGVGSVIIGNITATSAVIAGAVKGDIDVQGPVVVDTSAVIVGNIKSRSVQINNGAVIQGFCSQVYADVDVDGLFA